MSSVTVPIYCDVDANKFQECVYPKREPALLRNVEIGKCRDLWTCEYLAENIGNVEVKVHVSSESKMDFVNKNFAYKTLPFPELVSRASRQCNTDYFFDPEEFYYLRSLGNDPRGRDKAEIHNQFPQIASDLEIPEFFDKSKFFSSIFRIGSQGVQLWTHYDIMDNMLIQISGRKRVALYNPSDALNMYLIGDKSQVIDIDNPDTKQFPLFLEATRYECIMEPGDILFIPALWFHNTLALEFGIAVNVFWEHLSHEFYDKKDPYGNKDLVPASRALQMVENAGKLLEPLPKEYQDFYAKRMIALLQRKFIQ